MAIHGDVAGEAADSSLTDGMRDGNEAELG